MRAIRVDANGMLSACEIDGASLPSLVDGINDALGSDWYDVVSVFDGINVFVDDEAALPGPAGSARQAFNPVLSVMIQHAGRPAIFHGPGLFLGHDDQGSTVGLTEAQVAQIVGAWCAANRADLPKVTTAAALTAH